MKLLKKSLEIILILVAIGLFVFAFIVKGIIGFLIILAGIDLLCTVFWKPLFKKGPYAKLIYPDPKN